MTRADLEEILNIIKAEKDKEKLYCSEYIKNKPDDKRSREHDRDIVVNTLCKVTSEIVALYKRMSA